ncbi:transcriptional regulator [Candidatus Bathyarchaeota archaeon]|nr:MAG: transcriptional regulator [Candidatus Bathyarchaeota archaeon]
MGEGALNRAEIIEETESILEKAGFNLSNRCCSRPSCFDFAAKKDKILAFIKVHTNIGSASLKDASELITITENFKAAPLLIGEKNRDQELEVDTVYSRYNIYAINTETLREIVLKGMHPLVEAGPGGYYVQIDGELIRKKRQELGLSIGELAEMIGISRRTLYGYERGLAKASVQTAYTLEWILGAPLVKPINIFKSSRKRKRKGFFASAGRMLVEHCFLYKVFKKFRQFNFKITRTNRAPFDFIAKAPEEDLKILGAVSTEKENNIEKRVEEVVSICKVTGSQPIFITKDAKFINDEVPHFNPRELERMRGPKDILTVL